MDDTPEAVVEAFAGPPPSQLTRAQQAAQNRDRYEAFVKAGLARAEYLKRDHIAALGHGVADLMLLQIITGRLKPRTAKEAIEIADRAQQIARRETGEIDASIVIRTPEQRANAIDRLREIAQQAAIAAGQQPPPAMLEGLVPIEDAEVVEEGSIPRSTPTGAAVRTVRSR